VPNPSPANAHFRPEDQAAWYDRLADFLDADAGPIVTSTRGDPPTTRRGDPRGRGKTRAAYNAAGRHGAAEMSDERGGVAMDSGYVARNEESRRRLSEVLARLTADDLDRSLGDGWTVKAALAHVAFWDRYAGVLLDRWARDGFGEAAVDTGLVNDAGLGDWLALSPEAVRREAVAAAEALDERIARVRPELMAAIAAGGRERILDRTRHRAEHLDQIERALGE